MRYILCLLALFSLAACSSQSVSLRYQTATSATLSPQAQLEAGLSEVDITPPPGLPKAGFATWAKQGDGFRTRLKARAFFLRNRAGESLLLLQTDLLAGSPLLHAALSERLSKSLGITANNLVITATHTHAAPGGFFADNFYNAHAANAPGFEPTWFNFLLTQLESAALSAYQTRKPSKVALGQRDVWSLTRNRSLGAFLHNPDEHGTADDPARKFSAINPHLSMLRIDQLQDDGRYQPAGAFSSFSIHGTGIPSSSSLYHADIWAYLAVGTARQLQSHYDVAQPLVHGAFEASHADVAPNATPELLGFREARRIGLQLAEQASALFISLDQQLSDDLPLRSALTEVDVLANPQIGNTHLCSPAVGAALAAGAHEHRSPVLWRLPFIHPDQPRTFFTDTCQGGKHWLGTRWLQPLILAQEDFPNRWLIQSVHLGDTAWTFLPFEITVKAGQQIEHAVAQSFGQQRQPLRWQVVSSVANGYTGYVTTAEEYARQYYEGGHTLYGPNTAAFLAQHAQAQSSQLLKHGSYAQLPSAQRYQLAVKHYWPTAQQTRPRQWLSQAHYQDPTTQQEDYWHISWQDADPAALDWHKSMLQIQTRANPQGQWQPLHVAGFPVDDQGFDISVQHLADGIYEARWYNPPFSGTRQYRFYLQAQDPARSLFSEAFPKAAPLTTKDIP
ncbi:neutral/alkaline non-lysosomal ceramidase N-terminal domain-containing protein [Atopomonas sediminilitoris]|uniref:neutral/alkaline non-lysosomal ceramidase N-terminal domain-containing protein n=1 Tax=Atopomonas sediminilitoris TaxID=2919919 RepID=UPI001F4DD603|nr:neutral/alkaline non-lysosomal ceramidase N-terminal domain-containing protein [Atopomonas sediminilitoris]MCJ8168993.1 neutral/alkaline non-lysosomal ceramidase N-terminal domain-containing protein [Atopomonas sediminilitoris]